MSVTVTFDAFSDLCAGTMYGEGLLNLPEKILSAIDDYFDGMQIDYKRCHPDNVAVNWYSYADDSDVIVYMLKMLNQDEYEHLLEKDKFEEYADQHRDEIQERLSETVYVLGYDSGYWHYFDF